MHGAFNKLAQLSREELDRGVICASAGNHAQGVALAARTLVCADFYMLAPCLGHLKALSQLRAPCSVLTEEDAPDIYSTLDGAQMLETWQKLDESRGGMSMEQAMIALASKLRMRETKMVIFWQGCSATICMPPTTTAIKIEAVKRLGGDIELVGQTYAEAQTHGRVSP